MWKAMRRYGDLYRKSFHNCENELFSKTEDNFGKYLNKIHDDKFIYPEMPVGRKAKTQAGSSNVSAPSGGTVVSTENQGKVWKIANMLGP